MSSKKFYSNKSAVYFSNLYGFYYVRKRFGLVNFNFDLSDITNIEMSVTGIRLNEVSMITIFTSKGKKVKIGLLMQNFDQMTKWIKENVDEKKINKIYKLLKNRS